MGAGGLLLVSVVSNLMIALANITTPDNYRFPLATQS